MNDETAPHYTWMQEALKEAEKAFQCDEVPIGAVIVDPRKNTIIARGRNATITQNDPSAHAEIMAIRAACAHDKAQRIPEYDLYVTLEPCTMCAAAISFARIRKLIIAAKDEKGGGVFHGAKFYEQPTCHHRPEVIDGPLAAECGEILRKFFKEKRKP